MSGKSKRLSYWARRRIGDFKVISARRRKYFYFDKKLKKIIIGEKYEQKIKLISRLILLISIVSSFFTIPYPMSAIVSLSLIAIEQLLERVVYSFTTLHLVPFPSFDVWKKADFLAMIFAKLGENKPHNIGMVFRNPTFARDVWRFVEGWNYDKEDDTKTNNVRVTLVIHRKAGAYALFVYPDYNRPSVKASRRKFQRNNEGKEQQMLVGQMIMCKIFRLKNSAFEKAFLPNYKTGDKYLFGCWIMNDPPSLVSGTKQLIKNDLKIVNIEDLTKKDLEYHMAKYRLDWYASEDVKPAMFFI